MRRRREIGGKKGKKCFRLKEANVDELPLCRGMLRENIFAVFKISVRIYLLRCECVFEIFLILIDTLTAHNPYSSWIFPIEIVNSQIAMHYRQIAYQYERYQNSFGRFFFFTRVLYKR